MTVLSSRTPEKQCFVMTFDVPNEHFIFAREFPETGKRENLVITTSKHIDNNTLSLIDAIIMSLGGETRTEIVL
jgi:hypothetical protein